MPVASAIESLRGQLAEAMRAGEGKDLRFRLGPVELELQVEAVAEAGAETGVKFWVVSAGGRGSRSSSSVHTVKVTLHPAPRGGGDALVGDEDAAEPE